MSRYLSITDVVEQWLRSFLGCVHYIGPLREPPRRVYETTGEPPRNVGVRGELAPELIFRGEEPLLDEVNRWLQRFNFGDRLRFERHQPWLFSLETISGTTQRRANIADVGFGLSQLLPLISQCVAAKKRDVVVIEQPEIHLNPRLQALLAELFVETIKRGVYLLVETHSEHLLLRLRRLLAEEGFAPDDLHLAFVEHSGDDGSSVRSIPVSGVGHIDSAEWPKGFFGDSLSEALALAEAQAKRASEASS